MSAFRPVLIPAWHLRRILITSCHNLPWVTALWMMLWNILTQFVYGSMIWYHSFPTLFCPIMIHTQYIYMYTLRCTKMYPQIWATYHTNIHSYLVHLGSNSLSHISIIETSNRNLQITQIIYHLLLWRFISVHPKNWGRWYDGLSTEILITDKKPSQSL